MVSFRHMAVGLLVVGGLLPASRAWGLDGRDILLHAPFEETLDARQARGDGTGYPNGAIPFSEGKCGRGILLGVSGTRLGYRLKDNLRPEGGTICLWVRGLGDAWADGHALNLLATTSPGAIRITKDGAGRLACFVQRADNTWERLDFLLDPVKQMDPPGRWRHVAVTWNAICVRTYLDGRPVMSRRRSGRPAPALGQWLVLGSGATGRNATVAVDELIAFGRALSAAEVRALYERYALAPALPTLLVPRLATAPKIDGTVNVTEGPWDRAARWTGLVDPALGLTAEDPVTLLAGHDDHNLYLAVSWPAPAMAAEAIRRHGVKALVRRDMNVRDGDVWKDDAYEFLIQPAADGPVTRLVINADGTLFDSRDGKVSWNADWQVRSLLVPEGWILELAVPLQGFGIDEILDGTRLGFNLRRIWRQTRRGDAVWAFDPKAGLPGPSGTLVFDSKLPIVRLDGLGPISDGVLKPSLSVLPLGRRRKTVYASARLEQASWKRDRSLSLSRGRPRSLSVEKAINAGRRELVTLAVRDGRRSDPYWQAVFPVFVGGPLNVEADYVPGAGRVRIDLDAAAAENRWPAGGNRTVAVQVKADGRSGGTLSKTVAMPSAQHTLVLDGSGLSPRRYTVTCTLTSGDRSAKATAAFTKPPRPAWLGERLGHSKEVPRPWLPVQREGQTLKVWGRDYQFGENLLPVQIASGGEPLLAAPVQLVGQVDGALCHGPRASVHIVDPAPTRGLAHAHARLGSLAIDANMTLAYDGLLWVRLRLSPDRPTRIEHLSLEIPIRPERATLVDAGPATPSGQGRINPAGWADRFRPWIWLGNERGGIQWLAESDAGWRVSRPCAQVGYTVTPAAVTLRLALIDHPVVLEKPTRIAFGLMATPVRPPVSGRRRIRFGSQGKPAGHNVRIWWQPWGKTWGATGEGGRDVVDAWRGLQKRGVRVLPYVNPGTTSPLTGAFAAWGEQWRRRPSNRIEADSVPASVRGTLNVPVCPASEAWQDYVLDKVRRAHGRFGFRGLYVDLPLPAPCTNRLHGCGVRDPVTGGVRPTWNILGTRRLLERLRTMTDGFGDNHRLVVHSSGRGCLATLAFADVVVDGEYLAGQLRDAYYPLLPLDRYRAAFMGHPQGLTTVLFPQFARAQPRRAEMWMGSQRVAAIEHVAGLPLLHDALVWPANSNVAPYRRIWMALDRFGWNEKLQFLPYWDNAQYVRVSAAGLKNVVASLYRQPGPRPKVLVVLFNNDDVPARATLTFDLKALRLPERGLIVWDCHRGGVFPIQGGRTEVPVAKRSFRLLWLGTRDTLPRREGDAS